MDYHDPFVATLPRMRNHNLDMDSIELSPETVAQFDCVLIATDHDDVDYDLLKNAKLVVDSRGLMSTSQKNVIRA